MQWIIRHRYALYWLAYLISAVVGLVGGAWLLAQHVIIWIGALAWRWLKPLRRWLDRRVPGTGFARYLALGLVYSAFLGESLGVGLRGDLHPNLLINSFLWLGSFTGILGAWWWLARRWRWTAGEVFLLTGLFGVLVEQNFFLPRLLFSSRWAEALLAAPFIHALYAATLAPPVWLAGPLPDPAAPRPRLAARGLALALPAVLFFAGGLWIALWSPLFTAPAPAVVNPAPRGERTLGIDVTLPEVDDFDQAMAVANSAGLQVASLSFNWNDFEPADGQYGADPNWLAIANQSYPGQGVVLNLHIRAVDTNGPISPRTWPASPWTSRRRPTASAVSCAMCAASCRTCAST